MWIFFLLTGITELYECLSKDGVTESIAQCASSVSDNNQETRTVSCSYVSGYTLL